MGGIGPTGSVGGPEQQYALKWNDFHASILNSFRHLKDEEDFIDVTIACDGNSFTAHKVVLSACSPYFRSLLKANPCQHPIIILQDVREKDIEALLKFMYNGEVHIGQEQLPDFLKTAQTLQVRGLADVSTKDQHKLSNMSASIPWTTNADDSHSLHPVKRSHSVENDPPSKRIHSSEHPNSRFSESPQPTDRDNSSENIEIKPSPSDSVMSQSQADGLHTNQNSNQMKAASEPSSQIHSSNEDSNDSYDDEASDAEGTDNGHSSVTDLAQPKLEPPDYMLGDRSRTDSLMNPALFDPQRQRSGYNMPFNLQNLQDIAGLIPSLSGMHNNSQDSYGSGAGGSSAYIGIAEPKPICKECGRVYSSISNLKQHVANVHSTSPQWEPCPICGKHFKTRQYLFNHLLQTHGIRQRGNRMPVTPPFTASSSTHVPHHGQPPSGVGLPGPHVSNSLPQISAQSSTVSRVPGSNFVNPPPPPPLLPSAGSSTTITPHSPMDSNSSRELPHQATATIAHKDRELSSAVEQCLQYLSSSSK